MAEVQDDAEFWLPSEFLPDEDLFMEKEGVKDAAFRPFSLKFPNEFPFEFESFGSSSVIDSPVESTTSSSETESSDEEFLAALNQRLAQSVLYDTMKPAATSPCLNQPEKNNWFASGSPQCTLTGIGRFSGSGKGSRQGSPNGPLQFPSPPETPFETEKDTWNLIYAAAGQVARMQTGFDSSKHSVSPFTHSRTHLSVPCPSSLPCLENPSSVSFLSHRLYRNPPKTAQFHGRMYDEVLKEECSMECRKFAACSVLLHPRQQFAASEYTRNDSIQASMRHPWQTQSQEPQPLFKSSSFLESSNRGPCSKRESIGTGVFLPRNYSNLPEPRKQTALPTTRPLRLHGNGFSYKDAKERSRVPFNSGSARDYNVAAAPKYEVSHQQRQAHGADGAARKELPLLPLEWTY